MITHSRAGYSVKSESGDKNLGGPYKSKAQAEKRLRQVEYFKHHADARPKEWENLDEDEYEDAIAELTANPNATWPETWGNWKDQRPASAGPVVSSKGFDEQRPGGADDFTEDSFHIDAIRPVGKYERLDNGYLRADAIIARTGIQEYLGPNGTLRREYRDAKEVFDPEALASFSMLPVTNEHPPRPLDAKNTGNFQVGSIGEHVVRDGDYVKAKILITDAETVRQILSGTKVGLSCGYTAKTVPTTGTYRGQRYDSVQQNIRGNHVALTSTPRGGSDIRIKMDSLGAVVESNYSGTSNPPEETRMATYKIDSTDFEVSETLAAELNRKDAERKEKRDALKAELETAKGNETKATARADAAEAELKSLTESLPKDFAAAVKARVALETEAGKREVKTDSLSDQEVKVAIVEKIRGEKLARTDAAYVDAAYDIALSAKTAPKQAVQVRADSFGANMAPETRNADVARAEMLAGQLKFRRSGEKKE